MKHDKYNGWTNYETWNAALWLDNSEGSCSYFTDRAQELYDEDKNKESCTSDLADEIRSQFETDAENIEQSGWMADAVNTYLSEVDWYEIASHYMEDVEQEVEENTK